MIKISVRNLVEFILRKGDLDNRRSAAFDREAMLKGGRIHRKIQKQMNASYRAEVPLKWEQEYEEFIISVEGRADGIIEEADRTAIDEIKGVYMDLNFLEEPIEVHKAQAMCYAYIYGSQSGKDEIQVQMTYCQMESEEIKRFTEDFTIEKLKKWFEDLLGAYYKWAKFQYDRRILRRNSMEGLEFPYPYRQGQRELVTGVYHTITTGRQLFIQKELGIKSVTDTAGGDKHMDFFQFAGFWIIQYFRFVTNPVNKDFLTRNTFNSHVNVPGSVVFFYITVVVFNKL